MFRGNSFHTIDPKGRIIIPARFRDVLQASSFNSLMISKMDCGLVAYPFEEWQKIEKRVLDMSVKSETMRKFRRFFIGGAFDCPHDKQERILLPQALREYAKLNKEIVLVGVLDHFEIWARESWCNEEDQFEKDINTNKEMRDEIAQLGL